MSVIEYAVKFNELSRFAPNQVATEEMRVDHFEQGLKGEIKQIIAGYAYTSFQEMYQRAVKIARIISETEIEDRGKGKIKEKFGPGGCISQGGKGFRTVKYGMKQDKGKQATPSETKESM